MFILVCFLCFFCIVYYSEKKKKRLKINNTPYGEFFNYLTYQDII